MYSKNKNSKIENVENFEKKSEIISEDNSFWESLRDFPESQIVEQENKIKNQENKIDNIPLLDILKNQISSPFVIVQKS